MLGIKIGNVFHSKSFWVFQEVPDVWSNHLPGFLEIEAWVLVSSRAWDGAHGVFLGPDRKKQGVVLLGMYLGILLMTVDGYGCHIAKLVPPTDKFMNSKPQLQYLLICSCPSLSTG